MRYDNFMTMTRRCIYSNAINRLWFESSSIQEVISIFSSQGNLISTTLLLSLLFSYTKYQPWSRQFSLWLWPSLPLLPVSHLLATSSTARLDLRTSWTMARMCVTQFGVLADLEEASLSHASRTRDTTWSWLWTEAGLITTRLMVVTLGDKQHQL